MTSIPQYYIKFDADSNIFTGDNFGNDYLFSVTWNNYTKTWSQVLQEYSPSGKNWQIVESKDNYSNFYSEEDSSIISQKINNTDYRTCCYVSFPVDLHWMNYPSNYFMSFHLKNNIPTINSITAKDESNKTILTISPVEFLDSTSKMSVPKPTYELVTQAINLTENTKSAPVIISSISESPALVNLSIGNNVFPSKLISFIPNSPQEIQPHNKAKFDLVYSGNINKTSSYLLPVNISIFPKIDTDNPNKLNYSSSPSVTVSQLFLYVTPEQPAFDIKTLPANILIGIGTAIGAAIVGLIILFVKLLIRKMRKPQKLANTEP